jgi:hypothetical protein
MYSLTGRLHNVQKANVTFYEQLRHLILKARIRRLFFWQFNFVYPFCTTKDFIGPKMEMTGLCAHPQSSVIFVFATHTIFIKRNPYVFFYAEALEAAD